MQSTVKVGWKLPIVACEKCRDTTVPFAFQDQRGGAWSLVHVCLFCDGLDLPSTRGEIAWPFVERNGSNIHREDFEEMGFVVSD